MKDETNRVKDVAASVARVCAASDLTLEETVTALGLAAKAMAISAAALGEGTPETNVQAVQRQLDAAMRLDVNAIVHAIEAALPSSAS